MSSVMLIWPMLWSSFIRFRASPHLLEPRRMRATVRSIQLLSLLSSRTQQTDRSFDTKMSKRRAEAEDEEMSEEEVSGKRYQSMTAFVVRLATVSESVEKLHMMHSPGHQMYDRNSKHTVLRTSKQHAKSVFVHLCWQGLYGFQIQLAPSTQLKLGLSGT